jgi:hypothetical protein
MTDLSRFKTGRGHVIRDGKRIAVDALVSKTPAPKRKPFGPSRFTQLPEFWRAELEKLKSAATWHLAHRTLRAAYIQKHTHYPEPIVLSKKMTGLARTSRCRATNNMVRLGLMRVRQEGNGAAIVTELLLGGGETIHLKQET